jgi:hypothetical protein
VTVNHGASGIGDALLGLCAVMGLSRELPNPIRYKVSAAARPFVELFAGLAGIEEHHSDTQRGGYQNVPVGSPADHRQMNQGYGDELRERGRCPRWKRYAQNIGAKEVALPFLVDKDRLTELGKSYQRVIALAPGTPYDIRAWPAYHWRALERELIDRGHRCIILDTDRNRCQGFQSELVINEPAHVVAGILLNAACCVSNDSGIAHFAAILRRPTVVLAGITAARQIFGIYPHAVWAIGSLGCSGCWWQTPHSEQNCYPRCPELATIDPPRVAALVNAAVRLAALVYPEEPGFGGVPADRRHTMTAFCRRILDRKNPLIVETGCQRACPDRGTGESTTLFGLVAAAARGRLESVDNNPDYASLAARLVRELPAHVHCSDATEWLMLHDGKRIDALYLDSADTWTAGFEQVCLDEAQAAADKMNPEGCILIDDTIEQNGVWAGKGAHAVGWLERNGWKVIEKGYQALLARG